jgi:AcrR family transcriptional regulator
VTTQDPTIQDPTIQDPSARRADLRRRQADLTRGHILDVAEEVFAWKGYANATMREIADAAGFSVASVYGFVDGKEALVAAIMDRHGKRLLELHEAVVRETAGSRDQLHEIIDLQVEYHLGHPNFGRLFQHTTGLSFLAIEAAMDDSSRRRLHEVLALLEGLFTRGIGAGEFAPVDVATAAILFSSIMQGYLFRMLFQHAETPDDRAELHTIVGRTFELPTR